MKHLLILVSVLSLCACASVPAPPSIELFMHHAPSGIVFCSKDGKTCPSLTIAQTHKFFMLKPEAWRDLNNYIDELIRRLEAKSLAGGGASVVVTANDLRRLKAHLAKLRGGLKYGEDEIQLLEDEPQEDLGVSSGSAEDSARIN